MNYTHLLLPGYQQDVLIVMWQLHFEYGSQLLIQSSLQMCVTAGQHEWK